MKFCKYCGAQLEDGQRFCGGCGAALAPKSEAPAAPPKAATEHPIVTVLKRPVVTIGLVAASLVVMVLLLVAGANCDYGSCKARAVKGSDYCYAHKCALSSCDNKRYSSSNFCYSHYYTYDEDANKTYVSTYQLPITVSTVYTKYNYTYAEGTIKNNSTETVKYVKIKGAFQNSSGSTVDTDWTYAVDGAGLAPGESCTWKMSVPKNTNIKKCNVTILDFDY